MTPRARAPFIWTPRQPIHPAGLLANEAKRTEKPNRWFLFRRTLELGAAPDAGALSITMDGRYILFINGVEAGRGPVRSSPLYLRYDTWEIAPLLHAGANVIAVLAHTFGVDTSHYEGVRGLWRGAFGEGGLWAHGEVHVRGAAAKVATDTSWRVIETDAWAQATPRSNHGLGWIESLDARRLPPDWALAGFDDSGWDAARELTTGGGGPEAFFGGLKTEPFPTLLPRAIPPMRHALVGAVRVFSICGQRPDPTLPIERRIYQELQEPLTSGAVDGAGDLLAPEGARVRIQTRPGQDISILLDFGRIITARPHLCFIAQGGEMIEIACSEHLSGEWEPGGPAPDARITPQPMLGLDAHVCRVIARPGAQVYERFDWCAIRWMQITVRDAPNGLTLTGVGARTENYPVDRRGRFSSSDPLLDQLWRVGAYTLEMCMHDAWEDCPSREQRQWLGDATVENLVGWAAFGPSVAPLNAKFLRQAAESQRPDGLTQMFAPGDHRTDGLLIPDWTLQWVLNAADHYTMTGDLDLVDEILPSIQKALAWFERLMDETGLIADMPYWHFMDWAGVGRHGYAAALNAQLAGAFKAAAQLSAAVGHGRAADRYTACAERALASIERLHWDERRGVYVDCVDPATLAQGPRVSQHANAAMALWGAPRTERLDRLFARMTDPKRLTFTAAPPIAPTGDALDPEDGVVAANTFYSHFVFEALALQGRTAQALALIRERFAPMLAAGATTLWESFGPTASLCHAFSASPTWQLSRHVLGVYALKPAFAEIGVTPNLAGLAHAAGVVPTAVGDVEVSLEAEGSGFKAVVQGPPGRGLTLSPPPGFDGPALAASADGRAEAHFTPRRL